MEEAETLCDRVAIVDQGRVIALGSPRELIATLEREAPPRPRSVAQSATLEDVFVAHTGRHLRDE